MEALATRLRLMDLVGWQRIAPWAEESEVSFEDLRLLLGMALKMDYGSAAVSELADLAGFSLDVAYPATHRLRNRGYLREERRQYSLSQQGQELVAKLDAAHREGIQAYVDQLSPDEAGGSTLPSGSLDDSKRPCQLPARTRDALGTRQPPRS